MADGTDSAALLEALLAELERCARAEASGAEALIADARDYDRWGLADEADRLRGQARRSHLRALLCHGKAASWRAQAAALGRARQ